MYDVDSRLDELAGLLRESGYRVTPQRLAVVRALLEDAGHPSAETVYGRISETMPTTSLATVYNTLDALRGIEQVLEVRPGQGPARYDVRQPHGHPHLLCTRCGRVEDAPISAAGPLPAGIRIEGWVDLRPRLDYEGLCPRCSGETHGERA